MRGLFRSELSPGQHGSFRSGDRINGSVIKYTAARGSRHARLLWRILVLLLAVPALARAGTPGIHLVIQYELGEALTTALLAFDGAAAIRPAAACAEQRPGMPRLAVVAGQPGRLEIAACRRTAAAEILAVTIGFQAIALVTPVSGPAFPVHSSDLFHALAEHTGRRPIPAVWRDVSPNLPDLPIGFLAPPDGSLAGRLFTTYIMEPACIETRSASMPFELTGRMEFCGTLRTAPVILRRHGGGNTIADWAASALPGQLAVTTLAELRGLGRAVAVLPLGDVLPTGDNVGAGRYPGAESVVLLIVAPHDIIQAYRDALRHAAFELLSERSIGPQGSLVLAGLMPLPPADRVALRSRAIAFVENP